VTGVFVPGFAARPSFYLDALGDGWVVHDPPAFHTRAGFLDHVAALTLRIGASDRKVALAGHSLGAAVAVAATARMPHLVERLLLVAPAGLPLEKPIGASARDLFGQVRRGVYPPGELTRALAGALRAPRAAWRLAQATRALDLRAELRAVRRAGVPCAVVACSGDTLTPLDHCRRIAELSGGRLREVRADGGHMWMVVDPTAFAASIR
jgi:pimeloyl-ACP methyl ester carboxylesterase